VWTRRVSTLGVDKAEFSVPFLKKLMGNEAEYFSTEEGSIPERRKLRIRAGGCVG